MDRIHFNPVLSNFHRLVPFVAIELLPTQTFAFLNSSNRPRIVGDRTRRWHGSSTLLENKQKTTTCFWYWHSGATWQIKSLVHTSGRGKLEGDTGRKTCDCWFHAQHLPLSQFPRFGFYFALEHSFSIFSSFQLPRSVVTTSPEETITKMQQDINRINNK